MTIRLTGTEDFGEFCNDVQFNDYEGKAELSTWFGQSSFRWTFLRHNLELVICDDKFSQPVISEQKHDNSPELISKFFLSGAVRTVTPNVPGVSNDYEEIAGYNYLFCLPDVREFEYFNANQHSQNIKIYWKADLPKQNSGVRSQKTDMNFVRLADESRGLRPPLNLRFSGLLPRGTSIGEQSVAGLNPPLIDSDRSFRSLRLRS